MGPFVGDFLDIYIYISIHVMCTCIYIYNMYLLAQMEVILTIS